MGAVVVPPDSVIVRVDDKVVGKVPRPYLDICPSLVARLENKSELRLLTDGRPMSCNPGEFLCQYLAVQEGKLPPRVPLPVPTSRWSDLDFAPALVQLLTSLSVPQAVDMCRCAEAWGIDCLIHLLIVRMAIAMKQVGTHNLDAMKVLFAKKDGKST